MAIVHAVQARLGFLGDETIELLAAALGMHRVEVVDMVSFYAFFNREPKGQFAIRLAKTPISLMNGALSVAHAFEQELGVRMGQTSADGKFALSWTSDTGMADQEPSALVNHTPLVRIGVGDVAKIIAALRQGTAPPNSVVSSNLRKTGPVLIAPLNRDAGLRAALQKTPDEVIAEIIKSNLRGRGGAGYPMGMKLKHCNEASGSRRYIICNADEGEPGTFKDRVLLTEVPDRVFAGMTIAGYAIGASEGIVYLRAEYAYLWDQLQRTLAGRRREGLLGTNICGRDGFTFDIRIEMGAGAYICGEESALIESLEGKRGAPRERPPFPTEKGYLDQPTVVNNVETLACVPPILEHGPDWFTQFGTKESTGTKLLSVAGDCEFPGVYEVPFGITVNELLDLVGGNGAAAVQISGPSGECIAPKDFGRRLCFEDLSNGGSTMVFGPQRDLLDIVHQFAEFFADEACGWCVPCRVGTPILHTMIGKIVDGKGTLKDVHDMEKLSHTVARTSRCGLGQTAPNPILSTLRNFPQLWESKLKHVDFIPSFDLEQSLKAAIAVQGRRPTGEEKP
jgi:[NiFe] hydrogenase diaphorase moiety large subunit